MTGPIGEDRGGPYVCVQCGHEFAEPVESNIDARELTPCCSITLYEQL